MSCFTLFHTKSSKSWVYITCTTHLNLNQSCFKCLRAVKCLVAIMLDNGDLETGSSLF